MCERDRMVDALLDVTRTREPSPEIRAIIDAVVYKYQEDGKFSPIEISYTSPPPYKSSENPQDHHLPHPRDYEIMSSAFHT